jgi:diguanylate cyclase (GGDEF)-like protein
MEACADARLESYRRLAEVYHHILSEFSLDTLLDRIADTLGELVPYDTLTIYEADEARRLLTPVMARDQWVEQILQSRTSFGDGITGWAAEQRQAVLANQAHLDPRVQVIPGTPNEPEALISVPLIARGHVKGVLNIYRIGADAAFTEEEFELAKRFGDAAALAMDNAQIRANLELQAQTDHLTGLYNHRYFHERLRAELNRASRAHDHVSVLMMDLDDFKMVNDVYGHSIGDQVLITVAELVRNAVRFSDVACRIGGEEFGVIMPSCDAGDALGLAHRLVDLIDEASFDPAGKLTMSIGIAQAPEHAMNPRELVACAEAAMMTAKARGKNRILLFDDTTSERPDAPSAHRDVRSIAHLKMLQSLSGKLNRLNDVRAIGTTIANELRTLIDYHNCRVYVVDGEVLTPVAFKGDLATPVGSPEEILTIRVGQGVTGLVAQTGESRLVPNALEDPHAVTIGGTDEIDESLVAVPMNYGTRTIGVIVISKLGIDQFDEDDVRLLEVLAGHASVALENARLYEAQRREAENARALLDFAETASKAPTFDAVGWVTVRDAARLLEARQVSMWLQGERTGEFTCAAHEGYAGVPGAEQIVRYRMGAEQGRAFIEGRRDPFVLAPEQIAEAFPGLPEDAELRAIAVVPLHPGDDLLGWLTVRSPVDGDHHFTEERLRLLAGIANQCSLAMQKARLYRAQKETAEIANALLEFSREVALAEGLNQVLERIVEVSARLLGSPKTSVWLLDVETDSLVVEALWGYSESDRAKLAAMRLPGERVRPYLFGGEPFVLRPEQLDFVENVVQIAGRTLLAIAPFKLDGERVGCIVAAAPAIGDYEFSGRKMRLLSGVAHQARLAIQNASSYENLEATFVSTVEALANALETKDQYTSTHAREITDMALEAGAELGMDAEGLKRLELGALFHDIGKIGIPSNILLKPGPLTVEERAVMETHPELGERILAPIERLAAVRPIVRHCHERWDGKGYPDGLAGEQIPIESRIIFVCDAFHAMTTDRPYRKALPIEEAVARLRAGAGSQFDPAAVEAFLRLLDGHPKLASAAD